MKILEINSLKELFHAIKELNKYNNYWFRGHSNINYTLNPSAYRKLYIIKDQYDRPVQPRLLGTHYPRGEKVFLPDRLYLDTFLEKLDELNIEYDKSLNIIELYCLAQHYGVYTPMLDWTTDATVALFFACNDNNLEKARAIFLLDPHKLNETFTTISKIFNSEEIINFSNIFPLAMEGKKFDKRICRQSGNFTVHGTMILPLEEYNLKDDVLIKISIPHKIAVELKSYLNAFGITDESIYVEKDKKDKISKSLQNINKINVKKILVERYNEWKNTPDDLKGISKYFDEI